MEKSDALNKATVLIDEIKKGNINASQLSTIMMGQVELPSTLDT